MVICPSYITIKTIMVAGSVAFVKYKFGLTKLTKYRTRVQIRAKKTQKTLK